MLKSYLCNLVGDVMRSVFNFGGDDGFLRGWRGGALLLIVAFREIERDEGNLINGAILVEVRVGGGAKQAGFDVAERP